MTNGYLTPHFTVGRLDSHSMAYIARLRTAGAASGTLTAAPFVPARGDKWYMDPEEMRQYDTPFHVKWGGGFPTSWGPNWRHDVYMNKNSMYPRMPYYQRQLKNPHLKYDYGIGVRKNYGETFHIMEVCWGGGGMLPDVTSCF